MSREVDTSEGLEKLSDEDIIYLHQRGQVEDYILFERNIEVPNYSKSAVPLEDQANTGNANTFGVTKEQFERLLAEKADLENQLREAQGVAEDDEDEEDDHPVEPYEDVKNDDLRTELLFRGLSVSGSKEDMAQRLREDDATKAPEGEDTEEES